MTTIARAQNLLKLGAAVEQGLAIVLIAVVLDRLTQAYANRPNDYSAREPNWVKRHSHLVTFSAMIVVTFTLAAVFKAMSVPPKEMTMTFGTQLDDAVRWFSANAYDYIQPVRDFITVYMLIPLRDFLLYNLETFLFLMGSTKLNSIVVVF